MSGESPNFRELFARSLTKIAELKAQLEQREGIEQTPIAVIGMACRLPGGGTDPESFWQSLIAGVDGIRRIPSNRWTVDPSESVHTATRWAGMLDSVDGFDAAFFNISPREATRLDPQHRMLLELCWESLERAGQPIERLMGTRTGVFLGMSSFDYSFLVRQSLAPDVYGVLGGLLSTAAGRISYTLGLQGPCLTLDTACSSSMVAVHLACQSLRTQESNLALAGGVNLILLRENIESTAELQAMSPDGRCKTFDAEANGFALGEGCGMVVLKRAADAVRDGDPILAIIRSSAANHDGRTSGLTVPNVLSQQALLRRALELAKVSPEDIGYVETHGTGTPLGDPIEFEALREVLGKPRADGSHCVLGAVKTNVGHTAGAAGVTGLLKTILCLQHGAIPPNLNFRTLNPRISLDGTPFVLPTQAMSWPASAKPRRAGVSSFGISGTNAHVILEEAPRVEPRPVQSASCYLLPLSARSPEALTALAKRYEDLFSAASEGSLHDIAYTASVRRTHHVHRLGVVGSTKAEIAAALAAFADGQTPAALASGKSAANPPKVVFVFPGQGSQWAGMGQTLQREEPVFRDALHACDEAIRREAGFSILEALAEPEETSRLSDTLIAQPALFALEVALAQLLISYGVTPSAVIGHSVGEVAAAYVSGRLSLAQAAHLVVIRARVMQQATGRGKMVSVPMSEPEALAAVASLDDRVGVAAVNDPGSVVLSGEPAAIDALVDELAKAGQPARPLRVNYAFHSPQMSPLVADFLDELGDLRTLTSVATQPGAAIAMFSTVTGGPLGSEPLEPAYWGRNIRQTVRFSDAARAAQADGGQIFIEVGPHPVLALSLEQVLAAAGRGFQVHATLRRHQDERRSVLRTLAALYVSGSQVIWPRLFAEGGTVTLLPTYPWQRQRYWVDPPVGVNQSRARPADASQELFFSISWQLQKMEGSRAVAPGVWILFQDAKGAGASLAALLEAQGQRCIQVTAGQEYAAVSPLHITIDPANPEHHARLLREVTTADATLRGAIHLWSLDAATTNETTADTLDADLVRSTLSAALLAAALAKLQRPQAPRLYLITAGTQQVTGPADGSALAQAPLWGLGRSLALEHPELCPVLVDLPQHSGALDIERLLQVVLNTAGGAMQIALRNEGCYCAQLVRAELPAASPNGPEFRADGSYLITGGLGGLGLSLARWMVERGARHLVLASRRAPGVIAQGAIAALERAGARVFLASADVAKREEVAQLLASIADDMPPLRGIVHAAGVSPTVPEISRESLLAVTAPKIRGGWNLHVATMGLPLDFFVMYSSASAVLGLLGGGGYAAANAFLDGLARTRRVLGLPVLSMQWGAFAEVGMLVDAKGEAAAVGAMEPLRLATAHDALARALAGPHSELTVMQLSIDRHLALFPHLSQGTFWSAFQHGARPQGTQSAHSAVRRVRERLLSAAPERRAELLASYLRSVVAETAHLDPSRVAADMSFHAFGMDSLMGLELRNCIEKDLGFRVPIKDILASGQLDALAALIAAQLWPDAGLSPVTLPPGQWIVRPRPNPQATLRLICFPYAGGNASVYTPWVELLPPEIELLAIQPPGRQERTHEPLLHSVDEMVAALVPELLPYLDRPFAMFGHCIGAMVMYETIRKLAEQHGHKPVHIFPSGAMPPPQYLLPPVLTSSASDEFLEILRLLGFADESILGDDESVRDLLPAVSADFNMAIRYACGSHMQLDMPVTLFCGREDQLGPPDRTAAWRAMTTSRFEQIVFPGEHYFINPERAAMLRILNEELLHHVAVFAQKRTNGRWLKTLVPRHESALRLFCFPGAWELPSVFDSWSERLGDSIEVCVIERPGYGARTAEPPLRRVDDLVDFITAALEPQLDRPFAFLGHNIGSILMFEVTRRLRRTGRPLPRHLFVAATDAPHLYWSGPVHLISTSRLLESLKLVRVTVDPALPEHMLRADSTLLVSYSYTPEEPINVPITAFLGQHDRFVPPEALRGWKDATTAPCEIHLLQADHNILLQSVATLTDQIRAVCHRISGSSEHCAT